jgi:predicted nucleic acid-binding protein
LKISKLTEAQLRESQIKIYSKIYFINEELIPQKTWVKAEEIAREVDINDTDFIALSKHLKAILWTGDKELYSGLKQRRIKNICNTSDLLALRLKLTKF